MSMLKSKTLKSKDMSMLNSIKIGAKFQLFFFSCCLIVFNNDITSQIVQLDFCLFD